MTIRKRFVMKTDCFIVSWVVFCAVALVGGEYFDLYEKISWFDLILHFWAGLLLMNMFLAHELPLTKKELFLLTGAVTSVLMSWEIFEYFMDTVFDFNMQKDGIKDTMEDMLVGKAVCFVSAAVWFYRVIKCQK